MDYSNWMQNSLPIIGAQALRNISMPAAHDAGMSSSTNCALLANTCSTQTQTKTILGQLQAGIRYFDIRPAIYEQQLWTAHLDLSSGIGCNGESFQNMLNDVASFIARSGDLVILKFSHYYDRDAGRAGFTSTQMQQLINAVSNSLQRYIFARPVTQGRGELCGFTMNDYIGSGGVVLTVYDELPSTLWNPRTGVYAYADVPGGAGDLEVYDQYANTNNLPTMISDQLNKLENPANHDGNLFLLSWTLTLDLTQNSACLVTPDTPAIVNQAAPANRVLQQNLQDVYYAKKITPTINANLLYTDACDTTITDSAIWLNQRFYGTATAVA